VLPLGNTYVIDLRKYAPDRADPEFHKVFFPGGHISAAGYRPGALMIESYIDCIVRQNPEDFKQIGFVGTPYNKDTEKW